MLPTDEQSPANGPPHDPLDRADELLARTRDIARRIAERVRRATAADPLPEYRVCVFGLGDLDQRGFAGPQAFAEANAWYEALKTDPAVRQLWLIRRDGPLWQFVAGQVRRDASGPWEPVVLPPNRTIPHEE